MFQDCICWNLSSRLNRNNSQLTAMVKQHINLFYVSHWEKQFKHFGLKNPTYLQSFTSTDYLSILYYYTITILLYYYYITIYIISLLYYYYHSIIEVYSYIKASLGYYLSGLSKVYCFNNKLWKFIFWKTS